MTTDEGVGQTLPENWALVTFGLHTDSFDDLTVSVHINHGQQSFMAICHPMIVKAVIEKLKGQYGKEPSSDMMIPLIPFEAGKVGPEERSKFESWIWEWLDKKPEETR